LIHFVTPDSHRIAVLAQSSSDAGYPWELFFWDWRTPPNDVTSTSTQMAYPTDFAVSQDGKWMLFDQGRSREGVGLLTWAAPILPKSALLCAALGLEIRELIVRPWRLTYVIEGHAVRIAAVVDSRRDMVAWLERHLARFGS
jgi:hypothetical protein